MEPEISVDAKSLGMETGYNTARSRALTARIGSGRRPRAMRIKDIYSARNALTGSMLAARPAGTALAASATTATATTVSR